MKYVPMSKITYRRVGAEMAHFAVFNNIDLAVTADYVKFSTRDIVRDFDAQVGIIKLALKSEYDHGTISAETYKRACEEIKERIHKDSLSLDAEQAHLEEMAEDMLTLTTKTPTYVHPTDHPTYIERLCNFVSTIGYTPLSMFTAEPIVTIGL